MSNQHCPTIWVGCGNLSGFAFAFCLFLPLFSKKSILYGDRGQEFMQHLEAFWEARSDGYDRKKRKVVAAAHYVEIHIHCLG
jgi:hypothetical protein